MLEVLTGIIAVVVPAIITLITVIFKNLTAYKKATNITIVNMRKDLQTLQRENKELRSRIVELEKENLILKRENNQLKELSN